MHKKISNSLRAAWACFFTFLCLKPCQNFGDALRCQCSFDRYAYVAVGLGGETANILAYKLNDDSSLGFNLSSSLGKRALLTNTVGTKFGLALGPRNNNACHVLFVSNIQSCQTSNDKIYFLDAESLSLLGSQALNFSINENICYDDSNRCLYALASQPSSNAATTKLYKLNWIPSANSLTLLSTITLNLPISAASSMALDERHHKLYITEIASHCHQTRTLHVFEVLTSSLTWTPTSYNLEPEQIDLVLDETRNYLYTMRETGVQSFFLSQYNSETITENCESHINNKEHAVSLAINTTSNTIYGISYKERKKKSDPKVANLRIFSPNADNNEIIEKPTLARNILNDLSPGDSLADYSKSSPPSIPIFIPPDPCDDNDACTIDSCQKGLCIHTAKNCDDGKACTEDLCRSGVCEHRISCPTAKCHPSTGQCVPCITNADCSEALPYCLTTQLTTSCVACLIDLQCRDSNPCTQDLCTAEHICRNVALPNCCLSDSDCSGIENSLCHKTGGDYGFCASCVIDSDCQDNNPCTNAYCDATTGSCLYINNTQPCDDNSPCTLNDTCFNGVCRGTPKDCSDDNPCTDDYCDMTTGLCLNTTDNTNSCDDHNPCTIKDHCDQGECKSEPHICPNDELSCTKAICDAANGNCLQEPVDELCNDGIGCTRDLCAPHDPARDLSGCIYLPDVCDDHDPCTKDECYFGDCPAYKCKHIPFNCEGSCQSSPACNTLQ